jgi:putative serine protease PepD
MVALALVAALVGGGVGGYVGYRLADRGQTPASSGNVLNEPLPDVDQNPAAQGPVEAVATRVLPSTVQLRVTGARSEGEGSGMILSADGLILTNNHVVADAANGGTVTAVFQDGRSVPATIVGRDPSSDLAVVRATDVTGLVPIELGNSDGVRVGQPVVAFGSPLGLGGTVTTGIISALDRAVGVGDELAGSDPTVFSALQTDAAINPGNSGGPLVDMQGRVIGINSAIATTGSQGGSIGVGFAIPVNSAKRIAQELETTGRATRAVLGVGVGDDQSVTGARIQSVVPGGPADAAGIKAGDVVRKFGDKQITTGLDLQAQIRSAAPGATLPVQLADRTVQVTLGSATG